MSPKSSKTFFILDTEKSFEISFWKFSPQKKKTVRFHVFESFMVISIQSHIRLVTAISRRQLVRTLTFQF